MGLRSKTITGLKWSFTDSLANHAILFLVGIVLARLLSPTEYGIIGMITVFIAVSDTIVNSGLSSALIRKRNCTEQDYNTVFYTNIALGVLMFLVLFFSAGAIGKFYKNPDLVPLTRVMAAILIINSFGLVEAAKLTKEINFKLQTKISVISSVSSGVVGISLALLGFGYWSLAIKTLTQNLIRVSLLHLWGKWRPRLQYSLESFKELFGFGSKMMLSSLINAVYQNIYKLIIGKFFSAQELGYFTRAEQFKNLPSSHVDSTIQRVTYPVLSKVNDDDDKMRAAYQKMVRLSFYVSSALMLWMLVSAREIILILIGPQWAPAVPYLQIMCAAAILYPLQTLNLNLLAAKSRSDLFLRLEIIKKLIVIPVIFITIRYGIMALLWGMAAMSAISYFLNSMYSGKLIGYPTGHQLLDILPALLNAAIMTGLAFLAGSLVSDSLILSLVIKSAVAVLSLVGAGKLLKMEEYSEIKSIISEQLSQISASMKANLQKART